MFKSEYVCSNCEKHYAIVTTDNMDAVFCPFCGYEEPIEPPEDIADNYITDDIDE